MNRYKDRNFKVINSEVDSDTALIGTGQAIDSLIYNSAEVIDSYLTDCSVAGYATVLGSFLHACHVSGQAKIIDSTFYYCNLFESARIVNAHSVGEVTMSGRSMIIGSAKIDSIEMRDESIVTGDADVFGDFILEGKMYLHTGVWNRPPAILYATLSDYTVQECPNGKIHVNCTCNTPEKWLGGAGRRYGKIMGLSIDQSDEIIELIKEMRDICS